MNITVKLNTLGEGFVHFSNMQKVSSVKVGYPEMAKLAETCHKVYQISDINKKKGMWD
jgi:hypothetical protein